MPRVARRLAPLWLVLLGAALWLALVRRGGGGADEDGLASPSTLLVEQPEDGTLGGAHGGHSAHGGAPCSSMPARPPALGAEPAQPGQPMQTSVQDAQCLRDCLAGGGAACECARAAAGTWLTEACARRPGTVACALQRECGSSHLQQQQKQDHHHHDQHQECAALNVLGVLCAESAAIADTPECRARARACELSHCVFPAAVAWPPAASLAAATRQMCEAMPMAGCERCSAEACADPLGALVAVCAGMRMEPCDALTAVCPQLAGRPVLAALLGCPAGPASALDTAPPDMKMYFHTGIRDYLLLKQLVPGSALQYAAACASIVVACFASAQLRLLRRHYEHEWAASPISPQPQWAGRGAAGLLPVAGMLALRALRGEAAELDAARLVRRGAARAALVVAQQAVDYSLMLVAMTFNLGYCLALLAGTGLATLAYGHLAPPESDDETCCA